MKIDELTPGMCHEFSYRENGELQPAFLLKNESVLLAYRNSCPHTGAPLNWQPDEFLNYEGDMLQCSIHGALFRIDDGRCIHGPCLGKSLEKLELETDDEGNILFNSELI